MIKRRGPKGGYDFPNKRHYRRIVWKGAADFLRHKRATAQVLLLPSSEGDEIDVALSKGFKEYNLHIVDQNAAIVAVLKRRYPRANAYGVSVDRACERIAKLGIKLDFANFDMCSNIESVMNDLRAIAKIECFSNPNLISITVMRGRERDLGHLVEAVDADAIRADLGDTAVLADKQFNDFVRTENAVTALMGSIPPWTMRVMPPHVYRSARVTMLQFFIERRRFASVEAQLEYMNNRKLRHGCVLHTPFIGKNAEESRLLASRYRGRCGPGLRTSSFMTLFERDENGNERTRLVK
jgi:hypothetical protein